MIDKKNCFQKQLLDISNLVEDLQEDVEDTYTKEESDAKFATKTAYVSKANLTDYSINDIIVADSEIQSGEVDLRAVSAQDVKSEVSLDPTSAIIKVTSGDDNSTIGLSGTEIDITTGTLKYNSKEVATKDYIHQITLYDDNFNSSGLHCFLTFNIRNNVSTPYTTANDVYDALITKYGENKFIGGNGYYQMNNGYKELLFNISIRGSHDYMLDADYFEVDENFDSGNESIDFTNFQVKDIIL